MIKVFFLNVLLDLTLKWRVVLQGRLCPLILFEIIMVSLLDQILVVLAFRLAGQMRFFLVTTQAWHSNKLLLEITFIPCIYHFNDILRFE